MKYYRVIFPPKINLLLEYISYTQIVEYVIESNSINQQLGIPIYNYTLDAKDGIIEWHRTKSNESSREINFTFTSVITPQQSKETLHVFFENFMDAKISLLMCISNLIEKEYNEYIKEKMEKVKCIGDGLKDFKFKNPEYFI